LDAGWQQLTDLPNSISHTVLLASIVEGNSSLLIVGGRCKTQSGISELYDAVFIYDINKKQFTKKSSLPHPITAATGAMMDQDQLLIFGGDQGETFHKVETLLAAIKNEKEGH